MCWNITFIGFISKYKFKYKCNLIFATNWRLVSDSQRYLLVSISNTVTLNSRFMHTTQWVNSNWKLSLPSQYLSVTCNKLINNIVNGKDFKIDQIWSKFIANYLNAGKGTLKRKSRVKKEWSNLKLYEFNNYRSFRNSQILSTST